jgi:hypothetical protein
MERLRATMRFLDEAFRVPGTRFRFGWDPIIGLVPWVGDLLTAFVGSAIIIQAHRMRIPRVVQVRMLLNVGIDMVLGVVPFVGDLFDFVWKSNAMNFALLERHAAAVTAGATPRATSADWAFVIAVLTAIIAMAAIPLLVLYWVMHGLGRSLV